MTIAKGKKSRNYWAEKCAGCRRPLEPSRNSTINADAYNLDKRNAIVQAL
jgi:hypothetical protein